MLSYRYISFKVDWYLVSGQLYFTINLEEIFYFDNKKCRIYAAFGVSQTPKILIHVGRKNMADIKYEIKEELGTLSESAKGWKKELNLVSWNGAAPKYDLRDWAPEHEKMGKGITLSADEVQELYKILKNIVEG